MANINDWLQISQDSGNSGQTIVTVIASSYEELVERTASLKVSGVTKDATLSVLQNALVPSIQISESILSYEGEGGSQNVSISSNVPWTIETDLDWVTLSSTSGSKGNNSISISVGEYIGDIRGGYIYFKSSDNVTRATLTISQITADLSTNVMCVYETDEPNETIKLFGEVNEGTKDGDYLRSSSTGSGGSVKYLEVERIIIDGVVQDWDSDSFTIPSAGEHIVYIKFKDNKIRLYHATYAYKNFSKWYYHYQNVFKNNTHLKRITIPSGYYFISPNGQTVNVTSSSPDMNVAYSPFGSCSRLESITLGDNNCLIPYFAYEATNLKTFNMPLTDKYPAYGFYKCSLLENIKEHAENATYIYAWCFGYANISGTFNLENVHSVGVNAFSYGTFDKVIVGWAASNSNGPFGSATANELHIKDDNRIYAWVNNVHGADVKFQVKKIVMYETPELENTTWFGDINALEEIEFLTGDGESWIYPGGWSIGYAVDCPNLKSIIMHAMTAPILHGYFENIGWEGILTYPEGATGYDAWLSGDDKYLGYWWWNGERPTNPSVSPNYTFLSYTAEGGSEDIAFFSNIKWEISTECDWLTFSSNSGSQGDNIVTVTAFASDLDNERDASFNIIDTYDGSILATTNIEQAGCLEQPWNVIYYTKHSSYTGSTIDINGLYDVFGNSISTISNTYDDELDLGTMVLERPIYELNGSYGLSGIKSISLPNGIHIYRNFLSRSSINTMNIPDKVKALGNVSIFCTALFSVEFGTGIESIGTECFGTSNLPNGYIVFKGDICPSVSSFAFYSEYQPQKVYYKIGRDFDSLKSILTSSAFIEYEEGTEPWKE